METTSGKRTLAAFGAACALVLASAVFVYVRGWEMRGLYRQGFESSAFQPDVDCPTRGGPTWWLGARDPDFWRRFEALYPPETAAPLTRPSAYRPARIRFRGRTSLLPGHYGHLGGYAREVEVLEVYEMSSVGDCPP